MYNLINSKCVIAISRLLAQFAFHLSPDWELPTSDTLDTSGMKLGVRDMLVKHHLFSWNT